MNKLISSINNKILRLVFSFLISISLWGCSTDQGPSKILLFSKTQVFRHLSIEAGQKAFIEMGKQHGFEVVTTENSNLFTEENLSKYRAVVFLNTTGDVLNAEQQNAFERYIQAGGGYLGIHAAADTEYEWPWYNKLVGAWFESHPMPDNVQKGVFKVEDATHESTSFLPKSWEREDEFYSYKDISPNIHVLLSIDEKTYSGGTNGDFHPMAWYQEFEGGRSFYTAGGHTDASFSEPLFVQHLYEGLRFVMGGDSPKPLDYSKATTIKMPEENRFSKVILEEKLDEPMEMTVLPDNRVLIVERKGNLKMFSPATGKIQVIAQIPVNTKVRDEKGNEENDEGGLLGITKDPDFDQNGWIYLYYSPEGSEPKNILARFQMKGDALLADSKKVILEIPTQRAISGHAGGSLTFDSKGNLFLSTGDHINPHQSNGYSPSDDRPGRQPYDAQMTSANSNDLRGKILRIHPEKDGTYTIPEGNLFPTGTPKTRPEIYTMGHRNPFRISVDPKNGFLYWGDVGPDASGPGENRGPEGQDEVGQARMAGNFGWPYFVGDNKPYYEYDFETGKSGKQYDPAKPVNNSANNTGIKDLPPAQKAFIWYPYAESKEFPLVGAGGRSAMAGPVFYRDQFQESDKVFPEYYDGKLLIYEWMRGWIMAVTMDSEGNYVNMERFMPSYKFSNPMDMEFGQDGSLYMLEYGSGWFTQNDDARLIKIEYNGGNRMPVIQMASDKRGGSVPLKVSFSSEGTSDPDYDDLKYVWTISSENSKAQKFEEANPTVTFDKPGVYTAKLVVSDSKGGSQTQSLEILAGNEEPVLVFESSSSNQSFFFPNLPFDYNVKVTDKEDGSLENGGIKPEEVAVSFDYLPEGYDLVAIAQGHRTADANAGIMKGLNLIDGSDCKSCHTPDKKSVGPSYLDIANKYKGDSKAAVMLAKKVVSGGSGVWGQVPMSAHPQLNESDALEMVNYILSSSTRKNSKEILPVKGSYQMAIPEGDKGEGIYVVRAAYKDKGNQGIPPISAEKVLTLRNAKMPAGKAEIAENTMKYGTVVIASVSDSYIGFKNLDLTGIEKIAFTASAPQSQLNAAGGTIEIRLGSETGKWIGSAEVKRSSESSSALMSTPITANIEAVTGFQDVYFVFKNENAQSGQSLFVVMDLEFQTAASASKTTAKKLGSDKQLSQKELQEFVGKYKVSGLPFEFLVISIQGGKLQIQAGESKGILRPSQKDDRFEEDNGTVLDFGRDSSNQVVKITMKTSGFEFEGKKQ
jgi:cytochrome c